MQILNKEQILNIAGGVACECGCNGGARFTAINEQACHDRCCLNPRVTHYQIISFDSPTPIMKLNFTDLGAVCKPCTKYGTLTIIQKDALCATLASTR